MDRKLPKELLAKQETERRQTIEKVLRAINDLKSEECRLNIKNLMVYSGLSRSVFAKPHVRTVLEHHGVIISRNNVSKKGKSERNSKNEEYEYGGVD